MRNNLSNLKITENLFILVIILTGLFLTDAIADPPKFEAGAVPVVKIEGVIGPATAHYVEQAIATAETDGAEALILQLDTPGGLDTAIHSIIQAITGAHIPILGYIAPSGGRATGASAYILAACAISSMAPGTSLGPIALIELENPSNFSIARDGGQPIVPNVNKTATNDNNAVQRKLLNDSINYLRNITILHARNADWIEHALRDGTTFSAEEALQNGIVDLLAPDVKVLLQGSDGHNARVGATQVKFSTMGLHPVEHQPDLRTRLSELLSDPNVAYILLLFGLYGLLYEFANPGLILPGVLGALCLLMAFYAFQILPINYAGFTLIALGIALMLGEVLTPSMGALGLGGVIAFFIGSLILIDTHAPGFELSLPLIIGFSVANAGLMFLIVKLAFAAHRRPVMTGAEELRTLEGVALTNFPGNGRVRLHGETWNARSTDVILVGQHVRVTGRHGLTLVVSLISIEEEESSVC